MKILIAASEPHPHIGGKSAHVLALSDGLRTLGHQVKVLSETDLSPPSRLVIRGSGFLIKRILGPWGKDWATLWQYWLKRQFLAAALCCLLEKERFDVVSCQDVMVQNIFSSYPGTVRTILTVHGDRTNELVSAEALRRGSRAERWFLVEERQAYSSADQIVTVDSRLRTHVLTAANGAIDPGQVHVLYNFVNVEQFRPARPGDANERHRWCLGADDLTILCPRRLTAKNGVIYAVQAMVPLRERLEQCQPFVLLLAGDGPERRNIGNMIRQHGLESSVRLLGDVPPDEMPSLYRAANITLIPSVSSAGVVEATSVAALESMASGVPVIASAIGGLSEIIANHRTGILVPEKDPLAIAEAILLLIRDQRLRQGTVLQARHFVTECHSHLAAASTFVRLCNDG
jgi:glycosyltransferase involved in cell wall biosynthesis